jgi:hypothetical protein
MGTNGSAQPRDLLIGVLWAPLPSAGTRRNSNPSQRRCQIPPFLRRPVVEVARNADAANRLDGYRKIHHGQPSGPPAFGQYQRAGIVPWCHAWIQDYGEPGTPAGRHSNDVSDSQGLQGRRHGPSPFAGCRARLRGVPL